LSTRINRALSTGDQKSGSLLFTAVQTKYQTPAAKIRKDLIPVYKALSTGFALVRGQKIVKKCEKRVFFKNRYKKYETTRESFENGSDIYRQNFFDFYDLAVTEISRKSAG
jgi:hypothetical protein